MRRVSDGQPFSMSAEEFNAHQFAAEQALAQAGRSGAPKGVGSQQIDRTAPWVVNNTADLIRAFSCVKIIDGATSHETPGSDFFTHTPLFVGKPTDTNDSFLILQDGLPKQNDVTQAITNGVTPAWVYFTTGSEETAGPGSNSYDLQAGGKGAEILWKPSGTGSLLSVVRLSPVSDTKMLITTLTADLLPNGSATTAAGKTVKDDGIITAGKKIANGSKIYACLAEDGEYYAIAANCAGIVDA